MDLQSAVNVTQVITRKVSSDDHSHYEVDYTFAKITSNSQAQGSTELELRTSYNTNVLQTLSDTLTLSIVECDVSNKPISISTSLGATTLVLGLDEVFDAPFKV